MLIVITILFPAIAGIIFSIRKTGSYHYLCGRYKWISLATLLLGICLLIFGGNITLVTFSDNVTLTFYLDSAGRYFLAAVLLLYTCVAFYAFEYMSIEKNQALFFAFYYVSYGAMISVCAAGNLVTVYFCFEMATLTTVPLVLHDRTKEAVSAGLKYLFYSIGGALMGLFGVFFIYFYSAPGHMFKLGGILNESAVSGHEAILLVAVFAAIVGFGAKAGMYPMHGWLPSAHPVAPAPASSLLSGIIAKAGIIAVVRLIYYSVGADFIRGTWVQYAWMFLAMATILMGSMMAFMEKNLKKRLAYSTISQVSYIMLSLSLLSDGGLRGAFLHVMAHCTSKGCLFLCAGALIYKLGKRRVDELAGVGEQMKVVMGCFLIASLSLVGIPPMGGFLSKWVIALSSAADGMGILSVLPICVLLISALLTAGYLLPVGFGAFFPVKGQSHPDKNEEPGRLMTFPMVVLCAACLVIGLFGVTILEALGF